LDPEEVDAWIASRDEGGRWMTIEKMGPALHFLLTGDTNMEDIQGGAPFSWATVGGSDTD